HVPPERLSTSTVPPTHDRTHDPKPSRLRPGVFGIGQDIDDLDGATLQNRPPADRTAARAQGAPLGKLSEFPRMAIDARASKHIILNPPDASSVCPAEANGALGEGIKHRLQREGRPADQLEDIGGRGLPL